MEAWPSGSLEAAEIWATKDTTSTRGINHTRQRNAVHQPQLEHRSTWKARNPGIIKKGGSSASVQTTMAVHATTISSLASAYEVS